MFIDIFNFAMKEMLVVNASGFYMLAVNLNKPTELKISNFIETILLIGSLLVVLCFYNILVIIRAKERCVA